MDRRKKNGSLKMGLIGSPFLYGSFHKYHGKIGKSHELYEGFSIFIWEFP